MSIHKRYRLQIRRLPKHLYKYALSIGTERGLLDVRGYTLLSIYLNLSRYGGGYGRNNKNKRELYSLYQKERGIAVVNTSF